MAPRSGSGSLLITFVSPPGREPVALQWKIALGINVIVATGDLLAGEAGETAGKALVCAPPKESEQKSPVFTCILAGGKKAIPNGTVILVKYRVKAEAARGPSKVRVWDGLAVFQEANQLRKIPLSPVEGTITIR